MQKPKTAKNSLPLSLGSFVADIGNIEIRQTNAFTRAYKKLHNNQKDSVDNAVEDIILDPTLGLMKKGDLQGIYVYKFDCINQRFLLAYEYDPDSKVLLLVGSHKICYQQLKR